jgi:NodT family efflux transporter outer membrane factor (OMF) lipoprotein
MKTRWIAAAMLLLGACQAAGDDYATPEVALPQAWHGEQTNAVNASPAQLEEWWQAMKSPELDALVARAVESNLDLAIAGARVREARAELGFARSSRVPSVDVGAAYTRAHRSEQSTNGAPFFGDRDTNLYDAGFDAAWEIDVFGGIRREIEAASASLEATEDARLATRTSLIAEVARSYVELRGLERRLSVTRASIAAQESTRDIVRSRTRAGIGNELDLARAEAQVAASTSQVPALEGAIAVHVHALGVLVGEEPRALADELAVSAPIPAADAALALGQPIDLLAHRPDLRRAERECAAASARVGVAQAARWPRISIGASLGWIANEFGDLFKSSALAASVVPSLTMPLFDGGRRSAQVDAERARFDEAALAYHQSVLLALAEVEDSLAALASETTRHRSLVESVGALTTAVTLAQQQYTSGLIDFLSVLDAQRALFIAQDELAQSEAALSTDFIAVAKALGGGWSAEQGEGGGEEKVAAP